ncbi:MAG: hypothetical protein HZB53_19200 [Chloroflexi bacterium]|nr:hypothetical protein [Chloroflexota bacterium]
MTTLRVREVTSYGGFFGGDSITLLAQPLAGPGDELTLTIEQDDLAVDRHRIVAGMVLDAQLEGEHVVRATVAAAPDRAQLRDALPAAAGPLAGPHIFAHYCAACALWIHGEPVNGACRLQGHAL